jgi:hypothetical protein
MPTNGLVKERNPSTLDGDKKKRYSLSTIMRGLGRLCKKRLKCFGKTEEF